MHSYRLRAPSRDGMAVAQPDLSEAPGLLESNRRALDAWDHDFQGRSAQRLRREARSELLNRAGRFHSQMGLEPGDRGAADAPLVVTGHQPELFHPGVWAKNFAAASIARTAGGHALNLVVDNDVPHGADARVPTLHSGEPAGVLVDFDSGTTDLPYEDWTVRDEARFASFGARLRGHLHPAIADPMIEEFWPMTREAAELTDRAGLRFVLARHAIESRWGVRNAELPLSLACESEAFLWFVSHLIAKLPRFQAIHNESLRQYRRRYHIRSQNHPVSELHAEGDWREGPFWVWRRGATRRRALYARQNGDRTIDLRMAGEPEPFVRLPLAPGMEGCCAVERLRELPAAGIRLRPRALITTMFARLMVGDLFIHGIGGAKYDELGDAIVRQFFAVKPPGFLTFSLTLWPGIPLDPATPERLRAVKQAIRRLEFQPERLLDGRMTAAETDLAAAKQRAITGPTSTRRQRVERFLAIRDCNRALRRSVEPQIEELAEESRRLQSGLRRNRVATDRDFSFLAHSAARLKRVYGCTFVGSPIR